MAFLLIGLVLLVLKGMSLDPVAQWPWWQVLLPFGLAVAWWAFADATGFTQRRAMRRHEEQVARRRAKTQEDLGMTVRKDKAGRSSAVRGAGRG